MPQGADETSSNVSSGHPVLFLQLPIFDAFMFSNIHTSAQICSGHTQITKANTVEIIIIIIIIIKKYQFPSAAWWEGSRLTTASPEWYLTGEGRSTSSQAWCPGLLSLQNATHSAQHEQLNDEISDSVSTNAPQGSNLLKMRETRIFQLKRGSFSKRGQIAFASNFATSSQNKKVVTLTFSRHKMPDGNHVTFKQKIQICQQFMISRGP